MQESMNDLILTVAKTIKECGYKIHIEGNEVYFYAPETQYVFSIELQEGKFWVNRIELDVMPPFKVHKIVMFSKDTITKSDISDLPLQIQTKNLSELKNEKNFTFNNNAIFLKNKYLSNLYSQLCKCDIDAVTITGGIEGEAIAFELHNRVFGFSMLNLGVDIVVNFGMYQENGNDIILLEDYFFGCDEDILKWFLKWLTDYNIAFSGYCRFKFCRTFRIWTTEYLI